jgi:hypothetical protein
MKVCPLSYLNTNKNVIHVLIIYLICRKIKKYCLNECTHTFTSHIFLKSPTDLFIGLFFNKLVNRIVAKRAQMTLDVMYNIVHDV